MKNLSLTILFLILSLNCIEAFACSSEEELRLETLTQCQVKKSQAKVQFCVFKEVSTRPEFIRCSAIYGEVLQEMMFSMGHRELARN